MSVADPDYVTSTGYIIFSCITNVCLFGMTYQSPPCGFAKNDGIRRRVRSLISISLFQMQLDCRRNSKSKAHARLSSQ